MNKKCKREGCKRNSVARGYCLSHYLIARAKGDFGITKECKHLGCKKQHFAKGYCRKHYALFIRRGTPVKKCDEIRICSVPECLERTTPRTDFCKFHMIRKNNGKNLLRPKGNSGELNHMWRGGVSYYPNHYELKKNRIRVLEKANYICQYCGGKADRVHHKDFSKDNHSVENLAPSCAKCNSKMRRSKFNKTTKYTRLYGADIKLLTELLGLSGGYIAHLHKKGKLKVKVDSFFSL